MRSNYVRSFYLPEHQPSPPSYTSHFKSRTPPHCDRDIPCFCDCGRKKEIVDPHCEVCHESSLVVSCAQLQKLSDEVIAKLKPIIYGKCNKRFADNVGLNVHVKTMHSSLPVSSMGVTKIPKSMRAEELKYSLRVKGLSTSGGKAILVRRLEGAMAADS